MAQAAYHVSLAQFGPDAREAAFSQMLAQIDGGAAGAAAFERQRYRDGLPRQAPPTVPDSDVAVRERPGRHAGSPSSCRSSIMPTT